MAWCYRMPAEKCGETSNKKLLLSMVCSLTVVLCNDVYTTNNIMQETRAQCAEVYNMLIPCVMSVVVCS